MAIDWAAGGYRVTSWHARMVDRATWADAVEVPGVRSISVERSIDGDAPLVESGEVVVDSGVGEDAPMGWLRLSATCEQAGQVERVDLATLWCERVASVVERGADSRTLRGHSVLWPCSKALAWDVSGGYAPLGADGAMVAAELIRRTTPAPVVVRGGFAIGDHVVYDQHSTALEAAWMVLRAGGHRIRVDGDGTVSIEPDATEPALSLDLEHASIVIPSVSVDDDTTGVPSRYVAVSGEEVAEAVNDDPGSPTSAQGRGWGSTIRDESPIRVDGETLAAYAARRLEEESTVARTRSYSREWWPDVTVGDMVRGSIASAGLDGDMRIMRQRITCSHGIIVDEEARQEVVLWRRP